MLINLTRFHLKKHPYHELRERTPRKRKLNIKPMKIYLQIKYLYTSWNEVEKERMENLNEKKDSVIIRKSKIDKKIEIVMNETDPLV